MGPLNIVLLSVGYLESEGIPDLVKEYYSQNKNIKIHSFQSIKDLNKVKGLPCIFLMELDLQDSKGMSTFNLIKQEFSDAQFIVFSFNLEFAYELFYRGVNACLPYIDDDDNDMLLKHLDLAITKFTASQFDKVEQENYIEINGEKYICSDKSTKMLFRDAAKFAQIDTTKEIKPILITGPTGTGKEIVAKYLQYKSGCSGKFVLVNLAAKGSETILSEIFGHAKGAYTGAIVTKESPIKEAANGTIFFDEIGELDLKDQAKLLRFLYDGTYNKLGSDQEEKADNVRVIVATCKDVNNAEKFRDDLLGRLTLKLKILPLKDRPNDLALMIEELIDKYNSIHKKKLIFLPDAKRRLLKHPYPMNIRELNSIIENTIIKCDSNKVTEKDLAFE